MFSKIKMHLLRRFSESARLEYLKSRGMKVGKDTYIYSCRNFDGNWPWLIEIGDRVTVSTNVTILGHDASTSSLTAEQSWAACASAIMSLPSAMDMMNISSCLII